MYPHNLIANKKAPSIVIVLPGALMSLANHSHTKLLKAEGNMSLGGSSLGRANLKGWLVGQTNQRQCSNFNLHQKNTHTHAHTHTLFLCTYARAPVTVYMSETYAVCMNIPLVLHKGVAEASRKGSL